MQSGPGKTFRRKTLTGSTSGGNDAQITVAGRDYRTHVIRERPLLDTPMDIRGGLYGELMVASGAAHLGAATCRFGASLACEGPRVDQRERKPAPGTDQGLAHGCGRVVREPVVPHSLEVCRSHCVHLDFETGSLRDCPQVRMLSGLRTSRTRASPPSQR